MTSLLASFPSPPQGVWHLGVIPIRAYALCIIIGIIAALIIGDRRWVARGGEQGVIYDIALFAVPFGLVGGRLYHVMTDWPKYFGPDGAGIVGALRIWEGGLGIWGAVALGGVGAWIGCRIRGIPLPAFGDAIAPGIVLAQAIGRIGNYFNQELYGRPTSLPWGLEIYERRDASGNIGLMDGVSTGQLAEPHPVHPTFLYELLWNVLVFVVLIYVDRRFKMGHGRLFALYVAAYCVGRFWVELLRNDPATLISGIRINSFTSTFVFIGAVVYIVLAPKGRDDPKSLAGKPREPTTKEPKPEKSKETLKGKDSELVEWTKELVGAAATSGVVAGVAVAAEEDDDGSAEVVEPSSESGPADGAVVEDETAESSAESDVEAEESGGESDSAAVVGETEQPADAEAAVTEDETAESSAETDDEAEESPGESDSAAVVEPPSESESPPDAEDSEEVAEDADELAPQVEESAEPLEDSPPVAEAAEAEVTEAEAADIEAAPESAPDAVAEKADDEKATEDPDLDEAVGTAEDPPATEAEAATQDTENHPQRRRFARLRERFR